MSQEKLQTMIMQIIIFFGGRGEGAGGRRGALWDMCK